MKKNLSALLLSAFIFTSGYGQINSITPQKIQTITGLSKNTGNPPVPPHRTCGTMEADSMLRANNPSLGTLQDFETWLQKKIAQNSVSGVKMPPVYVLPVIVHVIHNGEAVGSGTNISQAQVNSQIDVLNEDYRRLNADKTNTPSVFVSVASDPEITFCLAQVDPTGAVLAQPGIDRVNRSSKGFTAPPYTQAYIDATIKPATDWDPTKYFNVWVMDLGGGLLGYAQFPSNSGLAGLNANGGAANTDGCVILYTSFGRVGNVSAPYDKGRTLTHEAGHWLGLRHIWGDSNCGTDYCNDTPTQQTSNFGCPSFPHVTCSNGPNGDMFDNYMDYTDDNCMNIFSANQTTRMRTVIPNCPRRVELLSSTVCNASAPPTCAFTASSFTVSAGGSINYTYQGGGATSWSWTFQGGTPGTSTAQNPSGIVYNTIGTYNTTLIATNSFGTCTLTQVVTVIANVGCDTLNYPPPGTLVTYTGGNGYVCGWNTTYKDISKAEYFASYSPYTHVTGGLIYFKTVFRSNGSNASVKFCVWNNTGTGGSPGTIIGSKTITLQSLDAAIPAGGALYQIIFDSPIQVTTPFYFGINLLNFTNNDSLGVVSNTNGDSNPNTAWEQWSDNTWHAMSESPASWGISISQFMSPFMTNLPVNAVLTSDATSGCVGTTINFNGASSTNETSYNWSFTGGTPATSTSASQAVTYNTSGTYKAILTAGGACQGSDKDSIQNIIISPNPTITTAATNVSCNGGSNGTASSTPSGGTSPYTYSWSNGQTTQNATGLPAGTYTVTVTDNKGCNATSTIGVTQPSALTASATSTNANCGGSNGSATGTPSGGTSPYTFLWNNGQTSATATGLIAGTYTVTVTDSKGCTKTASATVSSSGGGLSATTSVNNVTCNGANTGTASATPTGGTSPYTYNWSNGATSATISGLSAATYSVTITDVNTCSVVQSVTVTQPSAISLTTSQINAKCGNANGTATVSATGGTTGYTYSWSNGQTASTATGLTAGTYTVTVKDANNCTKTANYTITNAAGPTLTTSSANVSCNGNNNGSATASPSGGTTPVTYSWSTGATTSAINNLSPGTYTVTVTDANNCTANSSVTITQPAVLNSSAASTNASCNGTCDGALSALASGGTSPYNYNWSGGLGTGAGKSNVCTGTYTVTTTDANNCTSTSSATVSQPSAIVLSSSSTDALCGSPNGSATVSSSGGSSPYTYLWNNGQTSATATGLSAGTYTVTVTDAVGCKSNMNVSVSNSVPNSSTSSIAVSCNGGSDGSASATPTGGALPYSYSWSNGGTSGTITGLTAGTYTVTVTDANGCTTIKNVTVNQPAALSSNPSATNVSCNGGNNGSATLTVNGGTSPYTYSWNNGATSASLSGLSAGTYIVTVTDSKNCTGTNSVTISEPPALSSAATATAATCNGNCDGTLTASSSGGISPYSYNWSGGLGSGANKSNVCAGNYTVTITDANNCANASFVSVTQPSAINLSTSSANATCGLSNGSASVNASGGAGGFSYFWSNGSTNTSITGLSAGTYSVTVTDASNCTKTTSVTVTNPGAPTVTTGAANSTCNGMCNGSASTNVSGGNSPYSYNWSNGQSAATATSLCAGTYTVTVTDAGGCASNSSVTVNQPTSLVLTTTVNNSPCTASASASASGGTSGYTYVWSNGQTSSTATGLNSGTYTVTATDANNCTQTATATVTSNPTSIATSANITNVSCNGGSNGSATLTASAGTSPYSYQWSNGGTSATLSVLSAGTYYVTVTDVNGCIAKDSVNVTQPSAITASTSSNSVSCNGGSNGTAAVAAAGGSSPYTYLWNDPAATAAATATGLSAGNYSVTVKDANNCTTTASATVTEPTVITLSSSSTSETCGTKNGTATINASGGTPPYIYQWDANAGSQTTQTATGLSGGTSYTVLVLDAAGCLKNKTVTVSGNGAVNAFISFTNSDCGASNGTATVNLSGGGTPPYSYLWSNGQTTFSANGLAAGNYGITVTDAAGCKFISNVTVGSNPGITLTTASIPSHCGGNNGFATVSAGGGVSPYNYLWSDSAATAIATATGLPAGNYSVIVTDVNGCADTATAVVGGASPLAVNPIISNENCGKSDGVAIANANGGSSPYNYSWSDSHSQTTQVATGLTAGNYTVTITDADTCATTFSVSISNTSNLSISALQPAGGHCGSHNGTVATSASGGPLPYTYQWSDPDSQTTSTATGLLSGNYSIIITDSAGCKVTGSVFVGSTPMAISDSATDETCEGKKDGMIDITISGGVAPYTYLWSNDATSEDLNNISAGEYSVTVTDFNGCNTSDSIKLALKVEGGCINIPSGFTPNGDGKNDSWKIRGIGNYPDIIVEIYNRWGSIVFSSKGYATPWDGTSNGNVLPSAAYYYIITLGDGTNMTGSVTIVR